MNAQSEVKSLIPVANKNFVKWGNYDTIETIIKSGQFYPCFITGLSGNGKTQGIKQACANLGREFVRVNITTETDESDLVGGWRLVDGNTVWVDGPVVEAAKRGAVLLLDEIDLASNKIMTLQPVLEGEPFLIKQTGELVQPKAGFTVFATANTKGQGSDDGKFAGTVVLNEALLDRIPCMLHQDYPSADIETDILSRALTAIKGEDINHDDKVFISKITEWTDHIRKIANEGALDDVVSTRRALDIIRSYVIFDYDRSHAIESCIERFNHDTKTEFLAFYKMFDDKAKEAEKAQSAVEAAKAHAKNNKSTPSVDDSEKTSLELIDDLLATINETENNG